MFAVKHSLVFAVTFGLLGIMFLISSLMISSTEGNSGLPASFVLLGTAVVLAVFAALLYECTAKKRDAQLRLLEEECDIKDVLEFAELHEVSTSYLNGVMPFQYCDGTLVGHFFASLLFGKIEKSVNADKECTEELHLDAIAKALVPLSSGYWCKKFFEGLEQSRHQEYTVKIRSRLNEQMGLYRTEQYDAALKALLAKRRRKLGLKPETTE